MKDKILILTSVVSMIEQFNIPNVKLLIKMGYEVHVACNFEEGNNISDEQIDKLKDTLTKMNVRYYQVDLDRNPMNLKKNRKAYNQILHIMKKKQI